MTRFVSKRTEIDAVQWFPGIEHPGVRWYALATKIVSDEPFELGEVTQKQFYVTTMHEQHVNLTPGDWIIAEPVPDRYYPCKPEVFARRYELANAADR